MTGRRFLPRFLLQFLVSASVSLLSPGARSGETAPESNDLAELIRPSSTVEGGVGIVRGTHSGDGRFFGLGNKETSLLGNIDLRGGGAYDSSDVRRWNVFGSDLGLDTRSLNAEVGAQGAYRLRLAYDELPFFQSNAYQTPLLGAGSTRLTLPAGFATRAAAGPSALPALGGSFTGFDIGTRRTRSELAFQASLDDAWQVKASYRHDLKDGSKTTGALAGSAGGTVLLLPEPLHGSTDQFGLSLVYAAHRRHLQLSYTGSLFRNGIDAISYQNPFSSGQLENRLGSPPDNQFHQFKIDGAYNLSNTTRLNAAFSQGRMTQDQGFLPYSTNPLVAALPQSSLHGLVITQSLNFKLTSRPWRNLSLLAAYRYDDRDNRTAVSAYTRSAYEAGSVSTLSNVPYSRSRSKASLEADYLVQRGSNLNLAIERAGIHRYCHQLPESCTEVERSSEDTLRAEWRQIFNERISGKLGYAVGARRSDDTYRTLDTATELAGMRKFLYADRDRRQLRSSLTAVVSEALAFNARLDLNRDDYRQSRFGLTGAESRAGSLDASYTVDDDFTLYAFYSREDFTSRLANRYSGGNQITLELPASEWAASMHDTVDALGVGLKHAGFFSGRLELAVDLIAVHTVSRYQVSGGSCTSSSCSGNLPSALPNVTSRQFTLKSEARYQLSRDSSVRLAGQLNTLRSRDYAYEGITATSSTRVLGTNEAPLNVDGHFVGVSYIHRFR
jgi:MtrB/PioB family decaheme-associated outer membrane protein